jgi:hypothetical protein
MPNGEQGLDYSVDDAPLGFLALERALGRRGTRSTRSREDANSITALIEAWFRSFRPQFAAALGDFPGLTQVDRALNELRARLGSQFDIADLRARLRFIARTIQRDVLPAYDAARWTTAATPPAGGAGADVESPIAARLEQLSADLAASYRQVRRDLADQSRESFLGPAGEIREVMRAAIHLLAPDDDVRSQSWYRGHEGRPTQAERVRFIVQQRSGGGSEAPFEASEIVDTKVGYLGRTLYTRASRAFHAGAQREEVDLVLGYVDAVLNEILPA